MYDFELVYKLYPRKEGKLAGFKKLQKTIKNEEQYILLVQAVQNYAKLCQAEGRERQYIKMWSTFCNNWQDYVDTADLGLEPADTSPALVFK